MSEFHYKTRLQEVDEYYSKITNIVTAITELGKPKRLRRMTLAINDRMIETIEKLQNELNVLTKAEVLRTALALVDFAAQHKSKDGSITLVDRENRDFKISLVK